MAAGDIPPTNVLLRIPGLTGDQAKGAFNVQSFAFSLSIDVTTRSTARQLVELVRLSDGASPAIATALALGKTLAGEVVIAVVDGIGADIATWSLKDPVVTRFFSSAAVGGNERATETMALAPARSKFLHVKSQRSAQI